jgi:unsaturated rhamnogalacturonyl hydrolase
MGRTRTRAGEKKAEHGPADPNRLVKRAADAVLRDFPSPPPFNWGEGVLTTGMMRAFQLTGEKRYFDFVRRFADHHHKLGIGPTLEKRGYCGHWGPGYPMLMLYEETKDDKYLNLAKQVADFITRRAERSRDGGVSHFNGKPQLWVDTLDMCCPVLSNLARITGERSLQEESIRQLEIFAKHLQDPKTGLFYHMYDDTSGTRTAELWGRGNGWVVMSYTETLKCEPTDSADWPRVVEPFKRQLAGIVRVQDERSGLWHTVLNDDSTYLEGSASSMFLYGMAECRRLKLLDVPYDATMRRVWQGLARTVLPDGRVGQVSAGTGPRGLEHYKSRELGTFTWGTGAFLLAACAYAQLG